LTIASIDSKIQTYISILDIKEVIKSGKRAISKFNRTNVLYINVFT
jgi:hypothetical protein